MKKKKLLKIVLLCVVIYAVFSAVIIILFNYIRNNPIDKISMTYLWQESNIPEKYGEIVHIGRNISKKSEKSEYTMKNAYTVETKDKKILVYVVLVKSGNEWKAESYEVISEKPK